VQLIPQSRLGAGRRRIGSAVVNLARVFLLIVPFLAFVSDFPIGVTIRSLRNIPRRGTGIVAAPVARWRECPNLLGSCSRGVTLGSEKEQVLFSIRLKAAFYGLSRATATCFSEIAYCGGERKIADRPIGKLKGPWNRDVSPSVALQGARGKRYLRRSKSLDYYRPGNGSPRTCWPQDNAARIAA
jgi:hypothetical protein